VAAAPLGFLSLRSKTAKDHAREQKSFRAFCARLGGTLASPLIEAHLVNKLGYEFRE
jgi:hypothetical protein